MGSGPVTPVYDPINRNVYVTNYQSNEASGKTVSVISTSPAPPSTMITSAIDANNNPVQNGSSTVSTSITFQVSATAGSSPIAGFECSLDASHFSTCATNTNPSIVNYNNLAAGQDTFKVRAVDTQGNKDHTPTTFTWTTLTPSQGVQNIINTIDNMHLSKGITTSLEAPLNTAIRQLDRNNDVAACNSLNAFIDQVDQKETNGQLRLHQASNLRQQATALAIWCSDGDGEDNA